MTISDKIGLSSALFVLLLVAVVSYHVSLFRGLATVNRELSAVRFEAALGAIELIRLLDALEEATHKLDLTRDPVYAEQTRELERAAGVEVAALAALDLAPPADRAAVLLERSWRAFRAASSMAYAAGAGGPPLAVRLARLGKLREQTAALLVMTRDAIDRDVARAAVSSREAERISWSVVGAAVLLSLLVSYLTARSIRRPLRRFTAGTRAVAEGKFYVQLDDGGDDEFARPAAAFNAMVRRLGDLDRMKKDFLAHVSHELKTPLVAMQETNKLLLDRLAGPLNARQRRMVSLNLDSARRLSTLISKVLDLSRLEAGALEYDFKELDLVALVERVIAELEPRRREKGVWLETELGARPLRVRGDRDRILQVVENLYENAIKFAPPASTIGLALRVVDRPPGHLPARWRSRLGHLSPGRPRGRRRAALLTVADSGPGVPDPHKTQIFEKFHQVAPPGAGARGGVGLGLAICREIVEAHRGAIWVVDGEDGGSVFHLLLPAARTRPAGEPPARLAEVVA